MPDAQIVQDKPKRRGRKVKITAALSAGLAWPDAFVMGIDPSMSSTGWAIVRFQPYHTPHVIAWGNVRTDPTGDMAMKSVILRSREIFDGLAMISRTYLPEFYAVELPVPSARGTGSQSGSIMVGAAFNALAAKPGEIDLYHPMHTKKVVTGNGRATKAQVKQAVYEWLGTQFRANADVYDAIQVALTFGIEHLTEQPT